MALLRALRGSRARYTVPTSFSYAPVCPNALPFWTSARLVISMRVTSACVTAGSSASVTANVMT